MLFTDEVETMDELVRKLKDNESLHKIKVAVVCFLVEPDGKWTLHRRGAAARDNQGKLQALGGSYNVSDGTFRDALKRELVEEIGDKAVVENIRFLAAQLNTQFDTHKGEECDWVILAYLGDHVSGEYINMEPERCVGLESALPQDFKDEDLSTSPRNFIKFYLENYR